MIEWQWNLKKYYFIVTGVVWIHVYCDISCRFSVNLLWVKKSIYIRFIYDGEPFNWLKSTVDKMKSGVIKVVKRLYANKTIKIQGGKDSGRFTIAKVLIQECCFFLTLLKTGAWNNGRAIVIAQEFLMILCAHYAL